MLEEIEIVAAKTIDGSGAEHVNSHIPSARPRHRVIVTKPFYLADKEMSQGQYEQVMGTNPSHFSAKGEGKDVVANLETREHPVEMVSWNDAAEFSAQLSQQVKLKPFYSRSGEKVVTLNGTGYALRTLPGSCIHRQLHFGQGVTD